MLEARRRWDWAFYGYEVWDIFEGLSGWVLTVLFAGAVTGLLRKE